MSHLNIFKACKNKKTSKHPANFFTFLTSNLLPEVLTNFLWGGKQAEEHDHPSRKLHNRGHQEGVLHTATVSTLFQCLVVGNVKWGGGATIKHVCLCVLHLISIFENTGSKESTQDVAYRGACTPQAKHKTTTEKEINGIKFIYRTALSIFYSVTRRF